MSTAAKDAPNLSAIQYKKGSAPSTPASGYLRTYAASDGTVRTLDATGTAAVLTAPVIDARAFGVQGDDTTDDTAALQAAINACASGSGTQYKARKLLLPNSRMKITGTLTVTNMQGFVMEGAGLLSEFDWHGNSTDPLLVVSSCRDCVFRGWGIVLSAALAIGVQQYARSSDALVVATNNLYDTIWMDGGGTALGIGWDLGGGSGQNNDFTKWVRCSVGNTSGYGWALNGFECYNNFFLQCAYNGSGVGVSPAGLYLNGAGAMWIGGAINGATATIKLNDACSGLVLLHMNSEGCGTFIDASTANCTITADTVRWSGDSIVSPYRLLRLDDSSGSFAHCIFGQSAPVGCDRLTVYLPGNSHSVEFVDCTFITHTDAQYLGSRIWETSYGMPTRLSRNRVGNQDGTQQGMLPEMRVLALNGAQPYVFSPGVYTMTNGSATTVTDFLTDGTVGREHLLGWEVTILLGSNTTFANTGNLRLAGGTPWTATDGSVLTLIFDGTNWREKTRMTA